MKINKIVSSLIFISLSSAVFAEVAFIDTLFPKQWGLKNSGQTIFLQDSDLSRVKVVGLPGFDINYLDTDSMQSEKSELIVAVLDSGIDLNHPDLKDRIWYNKKLCANATNAKNLPCNGFNFLDNNTNLTDDIGHGTHVAGIIAANKNNIGIVGASDARVKIMPLKVINNAVNGFVYNGKLITDVIADAMIFAIKNGAEVINLSLGWPKLIDTPKVRAAFQMAEDQNVVVIAAAGNNNKDLPTFPCSYESVICVGAHDNLGKLTDFTNHGTKVDVLAPGEYIVSTIPSNIESRVLRIKNYEAKRGSSQAAPYVTASVAKLKLLKSNLLNDEVRLAIYSSVKKVSSADKRLVKFGILDQKNLVEVGLNQLEEKIIVAPLTKNLTEIKFKNSDKRFEFNLPIKNFSKKSFEGLVCISSESSAISLDQECFDSVKLNFKEVKNIKVSGDIIDTNSDSQIIFDVTIAGSVTNIPVFFTRDLNNDTALKSLTVSGGNFDEMGIISNGRRLSRMQKVMDKNQLIGYPEYFFLEKLKQTEKNSVVSLLTNAEDKYLVKNILLPKVNKVLSIHRQDINLDGKLDYMLYALSNDKVTLQLFFFDQNLNPLFGNLSSWNWALTTFEGLPIDGGVEKFDWIKINTVDFGTILVPSINRIYDMPEEDNSKTILDRVVSKLNHQYYLSPKKINDGVSVNLRVSDSVSFIKKFRSKQNIPASFLIDIVKNLPQSEDFFKLGVVRLLVRATDGEETKYYEVRIDGNDFESSLINSAVPLEGAATYNFYDLNNSKNAISTVFSTLLNRSRANYVLLDNEKVEYGKDLINSWENPVIGIIGSFQDEKNRYFLMENRYTLSYVDAAGSFKYELPIYRDSSFPGQNFSESLQPIVSRGQPGVYVNSTLIFGERLYSMIGTDSGLIRPMNLSVSIPDGCVPLNAEFFMNKNSSQFVFLCTDPNKQISIKFLSM
jgi:hypothetical protein